MRTRDPWAPPPTPFTAGHVAPLGITEKRLRSALAAGAITRLRRGVYIASEAVPDDAVSAHVLRALAEQVAAANRVASHETAALAHGLPVPSTRASAAGPVHLTRPRASGDRSRRTATRRLHLADLPGHHVMSLGSGLLVTTPARTAVDVAARLGIPEGLMIIDAAARDEFTSMAGSSVRRGYENARLRRAAQLPLEEALTHVATPGAQRRLRALIALADVRRESPLESFSAGHMHEAGLPAPQLQVRVRTARAAYWVDFLWEEHGVIGEADGRGKYRDESAFVDEKIREGDLRDSGYEVIRWTGAEMFVRPWVVLRRIERTLASRAG